MSKFIHAKYMPPSIRLGPLLLGVLCWREFSLPEWLGWMLLSVWILIAAAEVFRMFAADAAHPILQTRDPQP